MFFSGNRHRKCALFSLGECMRSTDTEYTEAGRGVRELNGVAKRVASPRSTARPCNELTLPPSPSPVPSRSASALDPSKMHGALHRRHRDHRPHARATCFDPPFRSQTPLPASVYSASVLLMHSPDENTTHFVGQYSLKTMPCQWIKEVEEG